MSGECKCADCSVAAANESSFRRNIGWVQLGLLLTAIGLLAGSGAARTVRAQQTIGGAGFVALVGTILI